MSLLPEFNEKFEDLLYDTITIDTEFAKDRWRSPELWTTCASLRALQKLLNPDLNPLTFDEVKGWFDRKVVQKHSPEFTFIGECAQPNKGIFYYHYNIHSDKHSESCGNFFLSETGYLRSLNRRDGFAYSDILKEHDFFYNISELIDIKPLELFCQMKGYVNI